MIDACTCTCRMYVVGKDMHTRQVHVAQGPGHPARFCTGAVLHSPSWVSGQPPAELHAATPFHCSFMARYGRMLPSSNRLVRLPLT